MKNLRNNLTSLLFLLILFYSENIYSQKANPLQNKLDSLKSLLNKNGNKLSNQQKSILNSQIYEIKNEMLRNDKMLKSSIKLETTKIPEAYTENIHSRGSDFIPFDNYKSYLKDLNGRDCCDDSENWNYDNYLLDYSDFLEIEMLNSRIDFDKINYQLLHAAIFYETNRERENNGFQLLKFHQSLEASAFDHAKDMKTYDFFSHTSVVQGKESVGERINQAGFTWSWCGENIAISFGISYEAGRGVYTPDQNDGYFSYNYKGDPIPPHTYISFAKSIVNQWMNSPGHRANILNPNFEYLGVGTAHFEDSEFYMMDKFYGVQVFAK
jgi:uncharacterized protein YkwD